MGVLRKFPIRRDYVANIQYNLDHSNTDGSFTLDDFESLRNSSDSSRKTKYLGKFSDFIMKLNVMCIEPHRGDSN